MESTAELIIVLSILFFDIMFESMKIESFFSSCALVVEKTNNEINMKHIKYATFDLFMEMKESFFK